MVRSFDVWSEDVWGNSYEELQESGVQDAELRDGFRFYVEAEQVLFIVIFSFICI